MIQSMTAFARQTVQDTWGNLTCEMKSINHRYLELHVNLSEKIRAYEMPIRDLIKQQVKRGKVECNVRFQCHSKESIEDLQINEALVHGLNKAFSQIDTLVPNLKAPSQLEILSFPGVVQASEIDMQQIEPALLTLIKQTLQELIAVRTREGQALLELFLQRIKQISAEVQKVKAFLPELWQEQRQKLQQRFADAHIELDAQRLEQEMLLFAHRIDIAEEVERLETHLHEMQRVLQQGGAVGRRMDFMLQELNREANTLGSKSSHKVVTHAAVEMKVLIEQIREQVQNIE